MRRLRFLPANRLGAPFLGTLMVLIIGAVLIAIAAPVGALGPPLAQGRGNHMSDPNVASRAAAGRGAVSLGLAPDGAISGMVFFDANGDGVRAVDETHGIEGAEVVLKTAGGAHVGPPITTGPDGAYQFANVAAGSYVVQETDAPGFASTSSNSLSVNVGSTTVSGVDFADTLPFSLTGIVYNDANNNGIQEPSEGGLLAVPVELYADLNGDGLIDPADPLLNSTQTNAQGVYSFQNVMPGYRVLRITPPVGSHSPSGNQVPLNLISNDGGLGANEFIQNFPLLPSSETPRACAFNTAIVSNFNGTAIPSPRIIWFTARLKASGLPTSETTVYFDNGEIQFGANSTAYHLAPGRGKVVFSPTATSTTTTYDAGSQTWTTTVSPGNWDKEIFLTGLRYPVPGQGLPGGINPVTWSGRLSGTQAGITLEWQWSAAVYASLSADNNANGVKAVSSNAENIYNNGDPAGTPENYKDYVVGGARGGGGSNYVGGNSSTVRGLCITPETPPYGTRVNCGSTGFTDSWAEFWSADRKYTLGAWGYMGGSAKSANAAVGGTQDDFLYQKFRESPIEYRFTVPLDTYDILLRFAEFGAEKPGERVMRVTMEGTPVESALDIYAVAGRYFALDKKYTVTVNDGVLNIAFEKASGPKPPVISAIQVAPHPTGPTPSPTAPTSTPTPTPTPTVTPTPTNTPAPYVQGVNSGSTTYTDGLGGVWAGDKQYKTGSWGYTGGGAKSTKVEVLNTTDDPLYRAYREKPGEYRFTVPNGSYQVVLKFAEFTAANANERLMKISLEGTVVENSFSIWTAAGGKNTAVDRTYTVTVNDGLLNISFVKATGSNKEPIVSAVKVSGQ